MSKRRERDCHGRVLCFYLVFESHAIERVHPYAPPLSLLPTLIHGNCRSCPNFSREV